MCSHLILRISDYIATQPNNEELHKFRAIEGPHLPLNLAERHRRHRPLCSRDRCFVLGFRGQVTIWSKEIGFSPSVIQAYGGVKGSG